MSNTNLCEKYFSFGFFFQGGLKWWHKATPPSESLSPWYNATRSVNIEISSYGALALLENNLIGDALSVLKWLVNQRNDLGGFVSSQDSVVGLLALVAFAERFSTQANNLQLLFRYGHNAETVFNVNTQNSLVLQSIEVFAILVWKQCTYVTMELDDLFSCPII